MLDLARVAKSVHNRWSVAELRLRGERLRWTYAHAWSCGPGLCAGAGVDIEIYGALRLGRDVYLSRGCHLAVGPGASLELADGVFVGRNTVIVAARSIQIGPRTLIAEHCTIRDGDHQVDAEARRAETSAVTDPLRIGADSWVGAGARILRGSHLGRGVVVGANAVVRAAFEDHVVIAGVPARIVKRLPVRAASQTE
jgi:acetyltransferase-like isoleucine patch superfamily enzyme